MTYQRRMDQDRDKDKDLEVRVGKPALIRTWQLGTVTIGLRLDRATVRWGEPLEGVCQVETVDNGVWLAWVECRMTLLRGYEHAENSPVPHGEPIRWADVRVGVRERVELPFRLPIAPGSGVGVVGQLEARACGKGTGKEAAVTVLFEILPPAMCTELARVLGELSGLTELEWLLPLGSEPGVVLARLTTPDGTQPSPLEWMELRAHHDGSLLHGHLRVRVRSRPRGGLLAWLGQSKLRTLSFSYPAHNPEAGFRMVEEQLRPFLTGSVDLPIPSGSASLPAESGLPIPAEGAERDGAVDR